MENVDSTAMAMSAAVILEDFRSSCFLYSFAKSAVQTKRVL